MKEVSFYIPCFNAEKYLAECIESILNQTYPLKEIVLIDDGSTDSSINIASPYPIEIVKKEKNEGLALARNSALDFCSGEFIASCDSDVSLDSRWLEILMTSFSHNQLAGAGGKLLERNQEKLPDRWRAIHMVQHWGEKKILNPRFIYGANTVFRREVLTSLGKYNQLYRTNREDVDMCRRIKKAGYKIVYEPEAVATHMRTDTLQSIMNTFYGWKRHDYVQSDDFYNNYSTLIGKINFSINTCYDMISNEISQNFYDLIYLTVLILFRFVLRDVKACKKTIHELAITFLMMKNILLKNKYIKEKIRERILLDIRDILEDGDKVNTELEGCYEKDDFLREMKNLFGEFDTNFIGNLYDIISEKTEKLPSLINLGTNEEVSEQKLNLINRVAREKVKNFIQSQSSISSNFVLWENLRYTGEKLNLKLKHRAYSLLKYPSEKQSEFFWKKVENSLEMSCL